MTKAVQKVRNNGANSKRRGYGTVTVNKMVWLLHRAVRTDAESELIQELLFVVSPADGRSLKQPFLQRHFQLPTKEQLRQLFALLREVGDRLHETEEGLDVLCAYVLERAERSASLAEFTAYSGARIGKAISRVL